MVLQSHYFVHYQGFPLAFPPIRRPARRVRQLGPVDRSLGFVGVTPVEVSITEFDSCPFSGGVVSPLREVQVGERLQSRQGGYHVQCSHSPPSPLLPAAQTATVCAARQSE